MFKLSDQPISIPDLSAVECGGFVSFVGKVRNRNEGKPVLRLEYEAYATLAESEGERILREAMTKFGATVAEAIHRVGVLDVGDTAVWVGIGAAHRGAAFDACEYVIDQLKQRVPIWKKEHYEDGVSEWIGIEPPRQGEADFFERQVRLSEVGESGQRALREASVLVVGAGGLGYAALPYLGAAGFGRIGICDGDTVDLSNLHRQVLFGTSDVGQNKATLAVDRLSTQHPFTKYEAFPHRLDSSNVSDLVGGFDIVLDCTDNFASKFLLNESAVREGRPLISACLHRFEGQILTVLPGSSGGCLRCLWPEQPHDGCVETCAEVGVLGVVPGLFGVLQAAEAIKLVLGMPVLDRHLLLYEMASHDTIKVERVAAPSCSICGSGGAEERIDIDSGEARSVAAIDIREPWEWDEIPYFPAVERIPMSAGYEVLRRASEIQPVVLICAHGIRSAHFARVLRENGVKAYSLIGGTAALAQLNDRPSNS